MKILFVSSSDPATNPRTVKEMEFALSEGHEVQLIYFGSNNWSDPASEKILEKLNEAVSHRIDESWWAYRFKIGQAIRDFLRITGIARVLGTRFRSHSVSERSWYLHRRLKTVKWKPDMVVAHMLSSYWPAYKFAKRSNARLGLDVEDYHPGEGFPGSFKMRHAKRDRERLMREMLMVADYSSHASPMIQKACLELCGGILSESSSKVVNNTFWDREFPETEENLEGQNGSIKLMWFSQNISANRGIEEIVSALESIDFQNFTLHLYGNLNKGFYEEHLKKSASKIEINEPVSQAELHRIMMSMDVGLTLDRTDTDHNRLIALPNKIWAYLQAGLYVLASKTPAQDELMKGFAQRGCTSTLDTGSLVSALEDIRSRIEEIRNQKEDRRTAMREYAFDRETTKLKELWTVKNR